MAGVAAKFCYLNRVGPREFISFCERFVSHFRPHEFWMLCDRDDFDLGRFASILGEPESCVASLRQIAFRPPKEYVGSNGTNDDSSINIVYCPDCIKYGYHAIFHQLPWMEKCLIHGNALQIMDGAHNGSYVRRDILLIKDVYRLFFGEDSKWNYEDYDSWINKGEAERSISISIYQCAIEEVNLNKSLLEKNVRQYAGATPKGTSQVYEILRRLGGVSTSRLLNLGYIFESSCSIRTSISIEQHHYDCLSNLPLSIASVAEARMEWAILLDEKTTWSELAISAIEAMLKNHQICWSYYCHVKRRPSQGIHKSDFDFLRHCSRVVDVRHFQEMWLVPWLHREYFMARDRDSSWISYNSYIGRKLESCGLANSVVVRKIAVSPDGDSQIFSVDAWELDHWLNDVLDLILRIKLLNQLWSIFDYEQKGKKSEYEWYFAHYKYGVDWCFYETGSSSGELEIWSRHGDEMPNWVSLDRVQHNLEEK